MNNDSDVKATNVNLLNRTIEEMDEWGRTDSYKRRRLQENNLYITTLAGTCMCCVNPFISKMTFKARPALAALYEKYNIPTAERSEICKLFNEVQRHEKVSQAAKRRLERAKRTLQQELHYLGKKSSNEDEELQQSASVISDMLLSEIAYSPSSSDE